jgi:D-serine deaminase-like pyridoxal phosphate-dependent protein
VLAVPSVAASRLALRTRLDRATAAIDPPFAAVDLDAFDANGKALAGRACGKPLRVASKSVRCRQLLRRILATPGWFGVMSFTLPEAIWLVRTGVTDDVLVGYPTADRAALCELAGDPGLARAITLMVDSTAQVDFVDETIAANRADRADLRLCLELDASWRLGGGRLHVGVRRSPVHTPEQAAELAGRLASRPGYRLVGLMSYEAQIAGLGDAPAGRSLRGAAIRAMQRRSRAELAQRRAAAVEAVRRHADLEFVNGGGTGTVAQTAAEAAVTEVTAGSGLYGPALFDEYRAWRPEPAAFFALSVVRRPAPCIATVLGGGWIASGETSKIRQPMPWLPADLKLLGTEGAGEVQTPVTGPAADGLRIGDRIWMRHAKAGELCEHVDTLQLVCGDRLAGEAPTYRGESRAFL